ncbi:adhesion G protein-coupled receptor E4-like [Pomacea canaliculata]|nr:adhesion G protein-coupled receptor E4-like [Pomacea canaliculata]
MTLRTIPDSFVFKEKSTTAVRLFMDCSPFATSEGSQVKMVSRFYSVEQLATLIFLLVSIVSLLLVLLTYSLLPKLRNASGVIVMSLSASMLTLQGLGLLLQLPRGWLCLIVAWLLHWSQLATFLWNSVLAFDLTFTLRSKSVGHTSNGSRGRALWCYIMLCWLLPLLVVVCLGVMDHYGIYNVGYATGGQCYIGTCSSILWLMIVPMSATFLFNFSCYVFALSTIVHTSKMLRHATISSQGGPNLADKRRLLVYIRITLIMGLTWAFYFAAVFVPLIELWIVNIVLNSSQGLYFLISFVLKRRVRIMLRDRFSNLRLCKSG